MLTPEQMFNRESVLDMSFFNFRNAVTACYFADRDLRILKVNSNFTSFFPVLGNVKSAYFPDVLAQLGVAPDQAEAYKRQLSETGRVLIPHIAITIDGSERVFALLSTITHDETFSYLNGVQGQFIDRTAEWKLGLERQRLLEERAQDRDLIEEKTRELQRVADRLAKYLSPQIYGSIFSGKSQAADPPTRKNLTIFFSDIEGFTDISDGMEPERLSFLINTYLSEMADIAIEYGGTIDKFTGDAILVFFGDPETSGDRQDALQCARMALRMRARVNELEALWSDNGIARPLRVRMGITTGYCTVGNFGSEHRLEYTVLGSPVNLAARLQTAATPDTILISDSTYTLLRDVADCQRMDDMMLKGFVRPIGCYRLDDVAQDDKDRTPMTRVGKHVAVSIPDKRKIREAIIELRRIEQELEQHLPKSP
jgi:adenylate cyclase